MKKDSYESPLCSRYSSSQMKYLFSPDCKFTTWRRLWCALAESEMEAGLPITAEQVSELYSQLDNIDYDAAENYERRLRHDVMAHIRAYGDVCPNAKGIIHLGATSAYVDDNTDMIIMRDALRLCRRRVLSLISSLARFADKNKDIPTLSYTHFQAAQPTTVGKRACLWLWDFILDLSHIDSELSHMRFPGCKGTTGTCAGFLELFSGDTDAAAALEMRIASKLGFDSCVPVSGQVYSRKYDYFILSVLSGIAQSASKMATDMRLLAHEKELDEPFESEQVGSSAMPYKRNPMRCERICSLSRYCINMAANAADTAAAQWLERTLDDSANRRLSLPEAFLSIDAVLLLCKNVVDGAVVYPAVAAKNLRRELPFIATENILMRAVRAGGDRQQLHEALRRHAQAAAYHVKAEGGDNDMLERLAADPAFKLSRAELEEALSPADYIGMAPLQTERFLDEYVSPLLDGFDECGEDDAEIKI